MWRSSTRTGCRRTSSSASHDFDVEATIKEVSRNVTLVHLDPDEATRELADGKIVAVLTVPPGFVATLQQMTKSPTLEVSVTRGGTSGRVRQQVQALVYTLNQKLQRAYIDANLEYVRLLLHGGDGNFLGESFNVIGLDGTKKVLDALPQSERVKRIQRVRPRRATRARADR